ncbi:MAG TPA: DUF3843 family protein [Gillisia sp.]|nr:DUF3843 family protein [Gillisia sp.]
MKSKIYIKDWLLLKPYKKHSKTDLYYLKLSNSVKRAINNGNTFTLYRFLDENDINLLSCFLTSYFEDIISETNVWNSFTAKHTELYGKRLPFFNTDIYFENEVNPQDVAFLIWYFINTIQQNTFIGPYSEFILDIGTSIADVLEEEYEYAPENEVLKSCYSLNPETDDYYKIREFLEKIFNKTYLFYIDTALSLTDLELDIIKEKKDDEEFLLNYLRENRDKFLFRATTKLLSLHAQEWASLILGKEHPLTPEIENLSPRISGLFLYKSKNESSIYLEHISSGRKFELKKSSFEAHIFLDKKDTMIYIGMVQWKGEWWFSGISFHQDYDEEIILNEKNSLESHSVVNFIDHKERGQEVKEALELHKNAFINYNNGSQIAFLKSNEIDDFVTNYYKYFNASLKLNNKENDPFDDLENDFCVEKEKILEFPEDEKNALVFFNPVSGLEFAFGVNNAFPVKENPFYEEPFSNEDFFNLLISKDFSKELVLYCVENFKEKLPFFNSEPTKNYEQDLDFLLRFFKANEYHSKANITFSGRNKI